MRRLSIGFFSIALTLALSAATAWAHGVAGNRFFPATIAIDDPAVNDELALPSVSHIKSPDGKETEIGAELSKTITPNLAVSVGGSYLLLDPADPEERNASGEIGMEAIIPMNDRTGKAVGVAALVHFFLDDLFPSVFRPLFH